MIDWSAWELVFFSIHLFGFEIFWNLIISSLNFNTSAINYIRPPTNTVEDRRCFHHLSCHRSFSKIMITTKERSFAVSQMGVPTHNKNPKCQWFWLRLAKNYQWANRSNFRTFKSSRVFFPATNHTRSPQKRGQSSLAFPTLPLIIIGTTNLDVFQHESCLTSAVPVCWVFCNIAWPLAKVMYIQPAGRGGPRHRSWGAWLLGFLGRVLGFRVLGCFRDPCSMLNHTPHWDTFQKATSEVHIIHSLGAFLKCS